MKGLKRVHLFEFEDLAWFPNWIRDGLTQYLGTMHRLLKTKDSLIPLLNKGLAHSKHKQIVDLCSGDGGQMPDIYEELEKQHPDLNLTLSDLYPNKSTVEKIITLNKPGLKFKSEPVDAIHVPENMKGLRTMVCSFHHLKPEFARGVLENAKSANQPICIYEISDNKPPIFLLPISFVFTILSTFFITLAHRPMSFSRILFTYLIPIYPLFIGWDGAVSNVRTYTLKDLDILLDGLKDDAYKWEKGEIKAKGANRIYLLGLPQD